MDNNNLSEFAGRFLCIMAWIRNHEDWCHSHQFFTCLRENFTVDDVAIVADSDDDADDADEDDADNHHLDLVFHVDILTWFLDGYHRAQFGNDVSLDKVKNILEELGIQRVGNNYPHGDHSAGMTNIARKLFPLVSCTATMWKAYRNCLYSIRLAVSPAYVHAAMSMRRCLT